MLIGDLLEGDSEIGGQGLKVFLDRIGYLIFPPLGGVLAAIAWFWPFVVYALTIPVGLAAFLWMPETKGKSGDRTMTYLGDILRLTRHPRLVIAFSAGFLRFFLDYGFLTYFPLFLVRTHGISTATAGLLDAYTTFWVTQPDGTVLCSSAPLSASITVIAIGWNIFPSMPVSARIGM